MSFVQLCNAPIDSNGQCTGQLEWVELASVTPLTYSEFLSILPALVAILLLAWGIRQLLRLIFNSR